MPDTLELLVHRSGQRCIAYFAMCRKIVAGETEAEELQS
jgi:hypothetical protein